MTGVVTPGGDALGAETPARAQPHLLALVPLSTSLVDFTYEYSAMVRRAEPAAPGSVPLGREDEVEKGGERQ